MITGNQCYVKPLGKCNWPSFYILAQWSLAQVRSLKDSMDTGSQQTLRNLWEREEEYILYTQKLWFRWFLTSLSLKITALDSLKQDGLIVGQWNNHGFLPSIIHWHFFPGDRLNLFIL